MLVHISLRALTQQSGAPRERTPRQCNFNNQLRASEESFTTTRATKPLKMVDVKALLDRAEITDTITRFLRSLDDGNPALLASCLTPDMTMDLTPLNKAGMSYPAFHGREAVVEKLMHAVGKTMDSAHHVGNFLFDLPEGGGDEARVSCYALAQHFRLGEGPDDRHNGHEDYCLMGNRYDITLVRDGEGWKIKLYVVSCMWSLGNVDVVKV